MNTRRLIIRSLLHYWRTGIAVAFGVAIATAVIVGSLIVGDSVKGSIRDTALARLGKTDLALVSPHFFRSELAADLAHSFKQVAPAIVTRGTAENAVTEAMVPSVGVIGVDQSFWKLYDSKPPIVTGRNIAVSASLARDLKATKGDSVLVTIDKQSAVPSGTLFAHKSREDTLVSMRLEVATILPDSGVGGFKLDAGTDAPRNVFISREWLAEQIGKQHRANVLLAQSSSRISGASPRTGCTLSDYGLKLVPNPKHGYLSLQTEGMLLTDGQVKAIRQAASRIGVSTAITSVYLATSISKSGQPSGVPYSTIAGLEPTDGFPLNVPRSGIALNKWAADDLAAKIGDPIVVNYLIPNPDGTYKDARIALTLSSIVDLSGAANDRGLVPIFEGITDADRIDEWSTPFPVDLDKIRPKDETYWDKYRATPKAFINPETARDMWKSGSSSGEVSWVTSVRLQPRAGLNLNQLQRDFSREMLSAISPDQYGMVFRPVREIALAASGGTTDFGQLFLGMSFFIMLSGAGLAAMLMRLSAQRRASEVGTMMACGFESRQAVRVLVGEGVCLTLIGSVLGVLVGIIYAWGIISALTSWWIGAVGTSALWLHLCPDSVAIGGLSGAIVGILATSWGARKLGRSRVLDLLAGWHSMSVLPKSTNPLASSVVFSSALIAVAALLFLSTIVKMIPPQGAFFGCGALILVASLAGGNLVLIRALRQRISHPTISKLALRSAAANRGRSLLVIGLIASAAFVIVTVAANTRDFSRTDFTRRDSGSGGFALRAKSSLPIRYDLSNPLGRQNLGFSTEDESVFKGATVMPFLVSPGEDISCLNLAKPCSPRLLGVSPQMITRGGFDVATSEKSGKNPWSRLSEDEKDGAIPVFGDADSVMWTLHSGLGKILTIKDESGQPVRLRIVGLISGSIFASELLMSQENLKRMYPSVTDPRYFLISSANPEKVAESLRTNTGDLGMEVRTTGEVLNSYLRVQNTYLSVFLALGGLGVLLGTFGLVTVIMRSALERKREFALMLATGSSSANLAQLLSLENAVLLFYGIFAGTLSALVSVAPHILSTQAHINWGNIAGMLLAIAVIGVVSCIVAAGKVVNGSLVEALREE